jgi:hypothetical protein
MAEPSGGVACIHQASSKVPPTLTEGTVTPEILHRWERACLNYFRHKKIKKDNQVEDVLFEIKDLRLSRWIEANESSLQQKSFADFMADLREEALDTNWARKLRTEILRTLQDDRTFFDWVCEIESKNAILFSVPSARISNQQLCDHLEAHMNIALAQRCDKSSITSITDYREWTRAVKQEDKLLRQDLENARSISLNVVLATGKSRNASSYSTSATSRNAVTSPSTSSIATVPSSVSIVPTPGVSSTPAMPKLSDEEKKILADHDGCFKCRRPYAGHRTRDCPNGFPLQYQRVTTAVAEEIREERDRATRPKHIAAVLNTPSISEDLPSAVLGSGSEESDDSD